MVFFYHKVLFVYVKMYDRQQKNIKISISINYYNIISKEILVVI